MSEGVEVVVGEFELLEGHQLPHPVRSGGGGVGVHVEAAGHGRLCLPRHGPAWDRDTELRRRHPHPWVSQHRAGGPGFQRQPGGLREKRHLQTHARRGELIESFGTFPVPDRCFPV